METIFFPRKDYDVEICSHRLGKKMTYTEQTDTVGTQTSYSSFMSMAKARNIKTGCFAGISDFELAFIDDVKRDVADGKLWLDLYSNCPTLREKILSGETITEQEWNTAYNTELLPAFYENMGKKPVCLSYSHGNATFQDYIFPKMLGARNSVPADNFATYTKPTDYGVGFGTPNNEPYSVARFKSKGSSYRWYDAAVALGNDFANQLQVMSDLIDANLVSGGWVNNFTHWHNYYSSGNQQQAENYLDMLASKNVNNEIYFAGYGEAVGYLVFRQLITRAVMYSPNENRNTQLIIRLETDNVLNADTDLLQTPISVKFTTVGTPLAGMTIKSERNLVSLGGGDYIVELPFERFPYAIIEKSI